MERELQLKGQRTFETMNSPTLRGVGERVGSFSLGNWIQSRTSTYSSSVVQEVRHGRRQMSRMGVAEECDDEEERDDEEEE